MNRQQQNNILKGAVKRFAVTILCCIPALIFIGYWIRNLNQVATIAIFTVFMLIVIAIEEYIHIRFFSKRQLTKKILHKDEDVFK